MTRADIDMDLAEDTSSETLHEVQDRLDDQGTLETSFGHAGCEGARWPVVRRECCNGDTATGNRSLDMRRPAMLDVIAMWAYGRRIGCGPRGRPRNSRCWW